ncbi:hypothetical protein GQX73_g7182 [Xylaria multiplex]|uniref:amidase n=1 Tax=Xylaria multiplex TaxID=323545 RepID=A0A7C8ITY7_9PEZI|nr:hypothetical protein GQX73_g7182 [Xylaria multiplex]
MASEGLLSAYGGNWESRVAEKRAACQNAIPEAWVLPESLLGTLPRQSEIHTRKIDLISLNIPRRSGLMTERELQITESYDVASLLEGLAAGRFTSAEVTLAFCKRAAIAQQLTNCLTETFFEKAQLRAQFLDNLRADGKLAGPLHGLPISLKDTYQVEGTHASIGAVSNLGSTSKENSTLVEMLLGLGAVLYVKTNVSQVLMGVESDNNIFGRVLNPRNTMLTAGGSSGGEGALVAFRGSPLGVGTDLAGSIRIPSLCCGTYGFKPSSSRIAYGRQIMPFAEGILPIVPSAGPIANDMETIQTFMKTIIDARPFRYDATVVDVPWRSVGDFSRRNLRLGLLPEDPLFPLHPPVKEAIAKAVRILQSHGYQVIPLDVAECHVEEVNQIAGGLLSLDDTPKQMVASSGEPAVPATGRLAEQTRDIKWSNSLDLEEGMDGLQKLGVLQSKRSRMDENWRKLWVRHNLDAVIAPSAQNTAVEHDEYCWPAYSAFLNVLDYPACVIPFNTATKSKQRFIRKPGQGSPAYNPDAVEGAPCSIQIFTSRMRDEECLAVAGVVDACSAANGCQTGASVSAASDYSMSVKLSDRRVDLGGNQEHGQSNHSSVWAEAQRTQLSSCATVPNSIPEVNMGDTPAGDQRLVRQFLFNSRLLDVFSVGSSFSETVRRQVIPHMLFSQTKFLNGLLACAISWNDINDNQTNPRRLSLCYRHASSAIALLTSLKVSDFESMIDCLMLGALVSTFAVKLRLHDILAICRRTLGLIEPIYLTSNPDRPELRVFTTCMIVWELRACLFSCTTPTLRFRPPAEPHADRHVGLSDTLLPLFYDICKLSYAIAQAETISAIVLEELNAVEQSVRNWQPVVPEDMTTHFSTVEVAHMICQAQVMQAAALLVAHRLRYPFGTNDGPAQVLSMTILTQIEMIFNITKQPVRCIDLPLLVACIELKDAGRQKWSSSITTFAGFSPEFGEHEYAFAVIMERASLLLICSPI